jgi:hypothetical protein
MGRILRQTTVCRDGMHNAFTDMRHWQGDLWITYRKASDHVSTDARAVVAVSSDRVRFREVASLKMPGDVRDPKFFPVSDDKMALFFPSWHGGYKKYALRQYITFSEDGMNWDKPVRILGDNQWLWRIREHEGVYYALVQDLPYKKGEGVSHNLDLMTSTDLINWEKIASVGSDEEGLNESDISWRSNGEAWIVARNKNSTNSYFAYATAPYTDWTTIKLDQSVHAPVFLERGEELYVSGRCNLSYEGLDTPFPGAPYSTAVWKVTRGALERVVHIPAYGDCSYPGFIEDPDGNILLSYYSQHAYFLGVEDRIHRPVPNCPDNSCWVYTPNDVYLAELEL